MPGMRTALTNRVDVDYHYLIDTFDVPITNYVNDIEIIGSPVKTYKSIFTSIVKEKDNAFAILNFPKMSELSKHAYFKKAKGLCEICLSKGLIKQGEIVHHVIEMDSEKIRNERLAYGFDNLQLVCRECHAKIHERERGIRKKRYLIDNNGRVTAYD
jgi:hypothetical protein